MKTALIVDDNSENRYLLQCLFSAHGFEVVTVSNGREALDQAAKQPPDFVLSDILMPVMDGFTLCRNWRQSDALKSIPFVFYTATYTDSKDEQFALSLGADAFVVKPAEPDELMRLVHGILAKRSPGELPSSEPATTEETPYLRQYNEVLIRKLEDKLEQLEKANHRLRIKEFAIASSRAGIAMADLAGNFGYANTAFTELWGIAPETLTSLDFSLIFPNQGERIRVMEKLVSEQHWTGRIERQSSSGTPFIASAEFHVVTDGLGAPVCLMLTCNDITEQEHMRVDLQQAQRLESLTQFAAGIAHDFNNLLTVIFNGMNLGQLESARGAPEHPQAYVLNAFTRAKDLTQRLLNFGRGGNMQRRTMSLRPIIEESCQLALSGSGTTLTLEVNPSLWKVHANATELSQVFCNIIINARQAMNGSGTLHISASNCTIEAGDHVNLEPGNYVRVRFGDDGPGITPEVMARIFEPYFTSKAEGTGLGLAMSQAIITGHSGRIVADSLPGRGATFDVLLPASHHDLESMVPPSNKPSKTGSGSILWMDDDEQVARLSGMMLRRSGYDVTTASTGEDAIEVYREARTTDRPFDLVVLDLTVKGGLGGLETLPRLRQVDPNVVALACSGYSDEATLSEVVQAGFRGLITKPYLPHELYSMIQAAIPTR